MAATTWDKAVCAQCGQLVSFLSTTLTPRGHVCQGCGNHNRDTVQTHQEGVTATETVQTWNQSTEASKGPISAATCKVGQVLTDGRGDYVASAAITMPLADLLLQGEVLRAFGDVAIGPEEVAVTFDAVTFVLPADAALGLARRGTWHYIVQAMARVAVKLATELGKGDSLTVRLQP